MTTPSLLERALRHPPSVFATPEAVVRSEQLPREHKRTILERWRQLVGSPPSRESKMAGEPSLMTRLTRALAFLDTETGSHEVTHDQGFYTSIGDIRTEHPSREPWAPRRIAGGNGRHGDRLPDLGLDPGDPPIGRQFRNGAGFADEAFRPKETSLDGSHRRKKQQQCGLWTDGSIAAPAAIKKALAERHADACDALGSLELIAAPARDEGIGVSRD
jgi:hypothetical protein